MDKGERKQAVVATSYQFQSFSGSSSASGSSSGSDEQANMYRAHPQPRASAPQPLQQQIPYPGMPMYPQQLQQQQQQPPSQRPRPVVPGAVPQYGSGSGGSSTRARHSASNSVPPQQPVGAYSSGSDAGGSSSGSGSYSGSEESASDANSHAGLMQPPPMPASSHHRHPHHSRHSQHSHRHHQRHAQPMMPGMGMMSGMGMVPGAGMLPGPHFPMQYPAQYQQMLQMQQAQQAQHAARKAEKRKRKHKKHKKKKDKNAPKRAQTAYIFFGKEVQEQVRMELRKTNTDVKQKYVMLAIAERWKNMLPSERQHFEEKAKRDKERYAAEMAVYKPPSSSSSSSSASSSSSGHKKPKRKKHKKDPTAPKRAKTGYMLFTDENRDRVRSELKTRPNFKNQDVLTELGRLWKALSEEEKKSYNERVLSDRERYQKEITEYRKKQGSPPGVVTQIPPNAAFAAPQFYAFGSPKAEDQPQLPL